MQDNRVRKMVEIAKQDNSWSFRLDDRRLFLFSIVIIIIIALWVPVIRPFFPLKEEPFLELAVLGENKKAENYYPENDPTINIGEEVNWNIHIYNHMGKEEYVFLRIKLLNSTMIPPDSSNYIPSPAPVAYEIIESLANNETIIIPLTWTINSIDTNLGFTNIQSITINGEIKQVNVWDANGNNFRIIIELWTFDKRLEKIDFGWQSEEGKKCAWTQIWFISE
jgi:uncharacterized membrane protein